ncbi:MAG: UDP-N-acetylmuramoyl-tripeptide--D-alanyl-D-alanine ligase [Rhodospirillales bacterium]|nr:UDP-N-acetylmuramoyl-tripeptide--D-alanyl-D-alanine ligase [Rhodospirillales bacterium]
MILWSSTDAEKATGGRATCEWAARGVSIDTRTLEPGDLFIALTGNAQDGHAYVRQALDKGAAAAIVSHLPEGVDENAPLLVVPDTFAALRALGGAARARTGAKIIGVTGSVGKTGTKEMLAAAFGALGRVHASGKSFNNHWGVPFSLAGMEAGADTGIFEMGMNHAGEIADLTAQVRPDLAIITTIAPVHLEHFSSIDEIAQAKAEIFDSMGPEGIAVLNADDGFFHALADRAQARGLKRIYGFGESEGADARMIECLEAANGTRVKARIFEKDLVFTLKTPGRHIAMNALAVLLAVAALGGDVVRAARALEDIEPLPGRGRRETIDLGDPKNPVILIDESYNASPAAMRAAFKVLALVDPGRGGRRIAVLGDMYELGPDAARLHAELALPLKAANVDLVYTCGPLMKNLHDSLPPELRAGHRDDHVEMGRIVPEVLVPGDVVMVKGSRGGGEKPRMQVVVEALRATSRRER